MEIQGIFLNFFPCVWRCESAKMGTEQRKRSCDIVNRTLLPIIIASVCALLLVGYVWTTLHYPYYFMWDMDLIVAVDTLLIQSSELPTHINHTGFGLYLLYDAVNQVGQWMGWLSLGDIQDLYTALDPMSAMAELLSYERLLSPILVFAYVLAFWLLLAVHFRLPLWTGVPILLFLGVRESMFVSASMIRADTFSIVCWGVALLFLLLATRARRISVTGVFIFVAGVLLGLCFMNKLQSALYVVVAAVFFFFLDATEREKRPYVGTGHWGAFVPVALGMLSLTFFCVCLVAAWSLDLSCQTSIGEGGYHCCGYTVPTFTFFKGSGFPSLMVLAALSVSAVTLTIMGKTHHKFFQYVAVANVLGAGFVASLLLHFLMFSEISEGWRYLLTDFKIAFLREQGPIGFSPLISNRLDLQGMIGHFVVLFVVHGAFILVALLGCWLRFIEISWRQLSPLMVMSALAMLNTLVAVRYITLDLIWVESIFGVLTLLYLCVILTKGTRFRFALNMFCGFAMIALFIVNAVHATTITRRIDSNYNLFGWREQQIPIGVYGGHAEYRQFMEGFYATNRMRSRGFEHAIAFGENHRAANFIFQNQEIPLTSLGVVARGFPVWRDNLSFRITEHSDGLGGAILVDNVSVPRLGKTFYVKDLERKRFTQPSGKTREAPGENYLSLLIRPDLETLIFVREDDVQAVLDAVNDYRNPIAVTTEHRIEVGNGDGSAVYHGIRIQNYAEIPLDVIAYPYFSVLNKWRSLVYGLQPG